MNLDHASEEQADPQTTPGAKPTAESPATLTNDSPTDLARLTQEIADLKDKYVRAYAEMDNMRRRHERDRIDLSKFALESVFKDFLPALDSLEKALPDNDPSSPKPNGSGTEKSYYEGMLMVKRQLLEVFRKHGLEVIRAQGEPFDPNLHQAIQRVESHDVKAETVGSEYARGYMLNGRLLRPAMVSVLAPA